MRESKIEAYLRREVARCGGRCLKFVSPGRRGVPDRIVQWPAGSVPLRAARTHYVETKAPGKKLKPHQAREGRWLVKNGFRHFVLDTKGAVDYYIRSYK